MSVGCVKRVFRKTDVAYDSMLQVLSISGQEMVCHKVQVCSGRGVNQERHHRLQKFIWEAISTRRAKVFLVGWTAVNEMWQQNLCNCSEETAWEGRFHIIVPEGWNNAHSSFENRQLLPTDATVVSLYYKLHKLIVQLSKVYQNRKMPISRMQSRIENCCPRVIMTQSIVGWLNISVVRGRHCPR